MSARDDRRPTAAQALCEGLAAGLGLALADLLASGVLRVPARLAAVLIGFGLVLGLGAGLVAALARRPGLALALVVAAGGALNGLSLASKELGGDPLTLALAAVVALVAALPCLGSRPGGPLISFCVLAAVPAGSLLVGARGATVGTLLVALTLPLFVGLALRARPFRQGHLPRALLAGLFALALSAPVARLDPARAREDRVLVADAVPPADAPDVLLVVVDTLRADALDTGATDGLFAELAAEGVTFAQCVSTAPWTLPSMSSLLTSLLPSQHGATHAGRALPLDVTTLAEAFVNAGWRTAAFTGGAFVSSDFRLDQGFERFDARAELGFRPFVLHVPLAWRLAKNRYLPLRALVRWVDEHPGVRGVRAAAEEWLAERDRERPVFVLLHSYEAHDYYLYHPRVDDPLRATLPPPSERFRGRLSVHPEELVDASAADLAWFEAIYTARVAHVQQELGGLVDAFERSSPRPTVVALVSDHGEGWDAARGRVHHGGRLHEDLLHVPLLVAGPGLPRGGRVEVPVSTLDVYPTLLELAGVVAPAAEGAGRSLVPLANDPRSVDLVDAWSEERANGRDLVALRRGDWKVVAERDRQQAFQLRADPFEERPVPAPRALFERLTSFAERFPPRAAAQADLDQATLEHLRALGYVD